MNDRWADLVLEGGGVKGIGLVGALVALESKGYQYRRIAGTSAGAIVGALAAAGISAAEMTDLLKTFDYTQFQDEGWLDRFGLIGKGLSLLFEKGVYEGDFLRRWLSDQLDERGVRTFGDLRLTAEWSAEFPHPQAYKLVVIVADVSRGELVRLPWDYERYGLDPDKQLVADAVRASISIPFFYEPVKLADSYLVDGGVLSNFPIDTFDRANNKAPRWPTFGIKLSAQPEANMTRNQINGTLELAGAIIATMLNAHDQMHLDDPCVLRRAIFVDTDHIKPTDFGITRAQQDQLYNSGLEAGTKFIQKWDFQQYIKDCRSV